MSELLRLTQIRKSYGIGTPIETEVLHGIDLVMQQQEFAALIGPSGSGKSTLLNIIGLLEPATQGAISMQGKAINYTDEKTLTQQRAANLGFVFQFHHLLPAFSAIENVMMPRLINGMSVTGAARTEAEALLDAVGLKKAMNKKTSELSGGMQQRVAIARALSLKPALVLADEPTGNLDTQTSDEIFKLLRRFNTEFNTAFLIVTHDPRLAARCDRIVELVDGNIATDRVNPAH
ncbi:MAG: ABC transporter ATP-binding protein [Betaproteobacteria bacterium]|nr:MAG: ABC transporter ATP-binding protein [Betaproteobacteria bacterium]TAG48662.1 MAG: ABC transporter ATP-binding protein [Betaproteobacteria bacterium]